MTLDDFFTLTEMKDGLTSIGRVEELVCMMKQNNGSAVKNVAETARQWSTVASTLIVTVNQDCLDHFIHLDGLYFLDRWLQEAEKCNSDVADSSVEESISVLLEALKKLPIDNEKSVSSGIALTVKKFFGHKSFRIQERASDLFEGWNQRRDNDNERNSMEDDKCYGNGVHQDEGTVITNSDCQEHSPIDITPVKGSADEDKFMVKPTEAEQHSRGLDDSQTECVKDVDISVYDTTGNGQITSLSVEEEQLQEDAQDSSFVSNPLQDGRSTIDESPAYTAERVSSVGICSSSVPVEERSSDVSNGRDSNNDVTEPHIGKDIPGETGNVGLCSGSTLSGPVPVSSFDPAVEGQPVMQSAELSNVDIQESEFSLKKTLSACLDGGLNMLDSDGKGGEVGSETGNRLTSTSEAGGCHSENSSIDGHISRKPEQLETSLSRKGDLEAPDNADEISSDTNLKDCTTTGNSSKLVVDTKVSEINKTSDMDLEYGVEDALEVARQVAKEIEREVVDYREQFCSSSSEKTLEGGLGQPSSPNSTNSEKDQSVMGPQNETPNKEILNDGPVFQNKDGHLMCSDILDRPEECMHGTCSSQVTEALQIPATNTKMGICEFDLNEVCSEDMDRPRRPNSVPTIVSAKLPDQGRRTSPPRFQGERGWKGSAATSAFRPATGLKAPDGERTERRIFDFDLNVEGYGDAVDEVAVPVLGSQIPVSSGLPSGESSIEVSSRRAERLKLDLNRVLDSDDGGPSSEARVEGQFTNHLHNSSPSPASSSSSRHPPLRNFDLNGNPSFNDDVPVYGKSAAVDMNGSVGSKADVPVISILGSKVPVKGKEPVPQLPSFLQNGRGVEVSNSSVFIRSDGGMRFQSPMAYMPPPLAYGYGNLAAGSSMQLSTPIYGSGSINGMADSRGSSMLPYMMGTTADVMPSYPPSYLMSMTGSMMGMNGVGSGRPTLDLNTGFTMEAENRGSVSSRHAFFSGQGMPMEEQMRAASQSQSSKRKEPDGNWDVYPANYRRQPPWG